jgi:hypothetical protein
MFTASFNYRNRHKNNPMHIAPEARQAQHGAAARRSAMLRQRLSLSTRTALKESHKQNITRVFIKAKATNAHLLLGGGRATREAQAAAVAAAAAAEGRIPGAKTTRTISICFLSRA